MQMQHTKNLNPGRFELGVAVGWPIGYIGRVALKMHSREFLYVYVY